MLFAQACLGFNLIVSPEATSVDVSQSHERAPVGSNGVYPTFIPRAPRTFC